MKVQSAASDLLGTFHHCARSHDPMEALSALVTDCARHTSAVRGDLYLLELSKTRLALAFSTHSNSVVEKFVPLNPSMLQRADWRFRKVFQTKRPVWSAKARAWV